MSESFKVALTGRIRNGLLWQAAEKMGSLKALADHLNLSQQAMGKLVNMGWYPSRKTRETEKWKEIENKLLVLIGADFDDIFPPELAQMADRPLTFSAIKEVPMLALTEVKQMLLPPAQELELEQADMKSAIERALGELTTKQADILKRRFGIETEPQTLEEVANVYDVTKEAIRHAEAKALQKLRHPSIRKALEEFVKD